MNIAISFMVYICMLESHLFSYQIFDLSLAFVEMREFCG